MDKKDLQQIKSIVDSSVKKVVDSSVKKIVDSSVKKIVDKAIDDFATKTIKPSFDEVFCRLDKVENRLNKVENRLDKVEDKLDKVEGTVLNLPDKDYLDKKLADLRADLIIKFRQQEEKINFLIEILKKRKLINQNELVQLQKFDIFPTFSVSKSV